MSRFAATLLVCVIYVCSIVVVQGTGLRRIVNNALEPADVADMFRFASAKEEGSQITEAGVIELYEYNNNQWGFRMAQNLDPDTRQLLRSRLQRRIRAFLSISESGMPFLERGNVINCVMVSFRRWQPEKKKGKHNGAWYPVHMAQFDANRQVPAWSGGIVHHQLTVIPRKQNWQGNALQLANGDVVYPWDPSPESCYNPHDPHLGQTLTRCPGAGGHIFDGKGTGCAGAVDRSTGHLFSASMSSGAADVLVATARNRASFNFANLVPTYQPFDGGAWNSRENAVKRIAESLGKDVFYVAGPGGTNHGTIPRNQPPLRDHQREQYRPQRPYRGETVGPNGKETVNDLVDFPDKLWGMVIVDHTSNDGKVKPKNYKGIVALAWVCENRPSMVVEDAYGETEAPCTYMDPEQLQQKAALSWDPSAPLKQQGYRDPFSDKFEPAYRNLWEQIFPAEDAVADKSPTCQEWA